MAEETKMEENNVVISYTKDTKMKVNEIKDCCRKNKIKGISGKNK